MYLFSLAIFALRSLICKHYGFAENGQPKCYSFSVFFDFMFYITPEIFAAVYQTIEATL
jgi:hypothetical protein